MTEIYAAKAVDLTRPGIAPHIWKQWPPPPPPPPRPPILSKTLALTIPQQLQTNWCWVAVGSGISNFYDGVTRTQCSVVNLVFETIHPPFTVNCCDPANGSVLPCNGESGADQALDHPTHHFAGNTGPLTDAAVAGEINAGHPIAAEIAWSGGGAHFVAITGYTTLRTAPAVPSLIQIQDPASGMEWVSPTTFRTAYQGLGTWVATTLSSNNLA